MKGMPFTSGRHFAVSLSRFQRNVDLFILLPFFYLFISQWILVCYIIIPGDNYSISRPIYTTEKFETHVYFPG